MRNLLRTALVFLLLFLAVFVGARNTDTITVNFLVVQTSMQISTFMVFCIGFGMLLGGALALGKYLTWRVKYNVLKRQLSKLSLENGRAQQKHND